MTSLAVTGGEGNILDNIVGLGNPIRWSLLATDPKLKMFAIAMEDSIALPAQRDDVFLFGCAEHDGQHTVQRGPVAGAAAHRRRDCAHVHGRRRGSRSHTGGGDGSGGIVRSGAARVPEV
jgi:hypothetical protein